MLKPVTRDKDSHPIIINIAIHQEYKTTISIYVPNLDASKYIKQILVNLKEEIAMQ